MAAKPKKTLESSALSALRRAQNALFDCTKEIASLNHREELTNKALKNWTIVPDDAHGEVVQLPVTPEILSILPMRTNESVRDVPGGVRQTL